MADVTLQEVQEIITTTKSDPVTQSLVNAAARLVNARVSGFGYTNAERIEIQRWVAAHMIAQSEGVGHTVKRKKMGKSETEFEVGKGGEKTNFWQTARELDYKGALANAGGVTASFQVAMTVTEA